MINQADVSKKEVLEEIASVKKPQEQIEYSHPGAADNTYIQLLRNIIIHLSNVIKFSASDGKIWVVTNIVGDWFVLKAADQGPGY